MMHDLNYHKYNKEQLVLMFILFYPCITFEGLLHILFVNQIEITPYYLRKVISKLTDKKFINSIFIQKSENEIKDKRHIFENKKCFYIKKKGFKELLNIVENTEKMFFTENELDEIIETIKVIYDINSSLLHNKSKQQIINITNITVHNTDCYDDSLFKTVYLLNNIDYIEINNFYSFYIPKYIKNHYYKEKSSVDYSGIRINIDRGKVPLKFELFIDISETNKIYQKSIDLIIKSMLCMARDLNKSIACTKNRITINVNIDYSEKERIRKNIKKLFIESSIKRTMTTTIKSDYDDEISSSEYLLICRGNFLLKFIIPYKCDFYDEYDIIRCFCHDRSFSRYIYESRKSIK